MNFTEALEFLSRYNNYEMGFAQYNPVNYEPDRVGLLMKELGLDPNAIAILHIAGTKGKGSTAYYIAELLQTRGYKTGLYTSPHILSVTERFRIDGVFIPESEFASVVQQLESFFVSRRMTYFDALTLIAMVYFNRCGCDRIVLETGLGGRLDSTNFCDPAISTITPISYDHTALLGKTMTAIAREKAGIIKPGKPVFIGKQKRHIRKLLIDICKERRSPVSVFENEIEYRILSRTQTGLRFTATVGHSLRIDTDLGMVGDIYVENFLTAVATLRTIGELPDSDNIVRIAEKPVPDRMIRRGNSLIDVAHNGASIQALCDMLEKHFPDTEIDLYITVLADKEIADIAETLIQNGSLFRRIVVTEMSESARPSAGKSLMSRIDRLPNAVYQPELTAGAFATDGLNVFTGSFYAVKPLLKILELNK